MSKAKGKVPEPPPPQEDEYGQEEQQEDEEMEQEQYGEEEYGAEEDQDSRINKQPVQQDVDEGEGDQDEEMQEEEQEEPVAQASQRQQQSQQQLQSQRQQQSQTNSQLIKVKEQSPPASPPITQPTQQKKKMEQSQQPHSAVTVNEQENHIKCEIKDIQEFKWCLDSVKFPTGPKKFNDVVFSALTSGITLRSHSQAGTIMTKCLLKKDFFEHMYQLAIRKDSDKRKNFSLKENMMTPLIEFCLPFNELKQLVDGLVDETQNDCLQLEYPVGDNYLEVRIPEEAKGGLDGQKVQQVTTLQLETYEAQHNLSNERQLNHQDVSALIFGKIQHFKRALKEFQFLAEKDAIEIKISQKYPQISFRHVNDQYQRNHVVKFNEKIDDLIIKELKQECNAYYTIESLRLAFSRINNDNLICIVTMYNEGYLSVKHMDEQKVLMIESIILPLDAIEEEH